MNDTDSINLPDIRDVIQTQLRRTARTQRRIDSLGRWLTLGGLIGFVGVAVATALEPVPEWLRANAMTLAALGLIAGPILWVGSVGLQSDLRHYHAYKYDLDRIAAQLESVAHVLAEVRGQVAAVDDAVKSAERAARESYADGYTDGLAVSSNGAGRPMRVVPPPS